jgi:hypothetical protein
MEVPDVVATIQEFETCLHFVKVVVDLIHGHIQTVEYQDQRPRVLCLSHLITPTAFFFFFSSFVIIAVKALNYTPLNFPANTVCP